MSDLPRDRTVAIILAGAVAKGAFEAGALQVLADAGVRVVRIVAASSGALNGVAYAAAVRARRERDGAAELVELWSDHATLSDIVHPAWREMWNREAVSDLSKVRTLLEKHIHPSTIAEPAPINLRLVIAPLDGSDGTIGAQPATTYEKMLEYDGTAFDSQERLDDVFTAVLASSSFPLVFAPTDVPGLGRCVDGGAVNNAPIGYAIDAGLGDALDAVVVISPTVERLRAELPEQHGADYIGHLVDMLINERLYRDLADAEARNTALRKLAALVTAGTLTAAQLSAVQDVLAWPTRRPVEIVQIRPLDPLEGSAFSAFHEQTQRLDYIALGRERARDVLTSLRWI